jgi:hypothetical protein
MHALKDLLPEALRRSRLSRAVTAARVVELFNDLIQENLPPRRKNDIFATAFNDGILEVGCKNGPAADWLAMRQADLLTAILRRMDGVEVKKIEARIKYDF